MHVKEVGDTLHKCNVLNVSHVKDVKDTVYTYMYVLIILLDFFRLVKHNSMCEWRRRKDALHKVAEHYSVGVIEDTNLLTIHAKQYTMQPRDIQLAHRICGEKDWDRLTFQGAF